MEATLAEILLELKKLNERIAKLEGQPPQKESSDNQIFDFIVETVKHRSTITLWMLETLLKEKFGEDYLVNLSLETFLKQHACFTLMYGDKKVYVRMSSS